MGLAPYVHMLRRESIRRSGNAQALRDFDERDRIAAARMRVHIRIAIAFVVAIFSIWALIRMLVQM